jgi:hypothetical protein
MHQQAQPTVNKTSTHQTNKQTKSKQANKKANKQESEQTTIDTVAFSKIRVNEKRVVHGQVPGFRAPAR